MCEYSTRGESCRIENHACHPASIRKNIRSRAIGVSVATKKKKKDQTNFFSLGLDVFFFLFFLHIYSYIHVYFVINWIAFRCSIRRDGAIKNTQGERVANHVKRAVDIYRV